MSSKDGRTDKRGIMRKIFVALLIIGIVSVAGAETTFKVVSNPGTVEDILDVQVQEIEEISAYDLNIIKQHIPGFKVTGTRHSLRKYDEATAELEAARDKIMDEIIQRVGPRLKIALAVEDFELKELESEPVPE